MILLRIDERVRRGLKSPSALPPVWWAATRRLTTRRREQTREQSYLGLLSIRLRPSCDGPTAGQTPGGLARAPSGESAGHLED
jgi:hypothetical protein